jgi:hypothetical protein
MCEDYIAAGLPPERFWQITPRLFMTEMRGAAERMRRERGAVWDAAFMSRDGVKMPKRPDYVGPPLRRAHKPPSWQQQAAAWGAYSAGLNENVKGGSE